MSKTDRNSTPVVHGALHQASYGGWWFEGQNYAPIYWADEVDALLEKMRAQTFCAQIKTMGKGKAK